MPESCRALWQGQVAEILRGLACVSYLFLFLLRANKDASSPSQLYHDVKATIRIMFFIFAQARDIFPAARVVSLPGRHGQARAKLCFRSHGQSLQ